MKNTKGYEINFEAREIIITKKFSKAAGTIGTTEYMEMRTLRNDYGDYRIVIKTIEKKENKVAYKGLSIPEMRRFIKANGNQEEVDLFNKVVKLQEGNKGKYAAVKKWFLLKYKDVYRTEYEELTEKAKAESDKEFKETTGTEEITIEEIIKKEEITAEKKVA